MRKRKFLYLILFLTALTSCNNTVSYSTKENISKETNIDDRVISESKTDFISSNNSSIITESTKIASSDTSLESISDTTSSNNFDDIDVYADLIDLRKTSFIPKNELLKSFDKAYKFGNYSTGNFGGNSDFGFYRVASSSGDFAKLCNHNAYAYHDSCIFTKNTFKDIYTISVKYKSDTGIDIFYGDTKEYNNNISLPSSSSYVLKTLIIDPSDFIKISTKTEAYIKEFSFKYEALNSSQYTPLTYDSNRIKLKYDSFDNLKEGEEREIPVKIKQDGNNYEIIETKKFVYHSLSYLTSNYSSKNKADELALVDPLDVASYYMLFHAYPLNYAISQDKNKRKNYFSENLIRQISQVYKRTDGYAKSVPYNKASYVELDFDAIGNYSLGQRGIGRLVVWFDGFKCYDNNPVITYTDDHYETFSEFNNYYSFNQTFDANGTYSGYKFSPSQTLILK